MKGKISKDVLFGIFVVLLFLSTPLFMTYLPNMSRFEIYFFKNPEIREPLLKVPLLLHDAGMDKLAVCRIYLFLINLFIYEMCIYLHVFLLGMLFPASQIINMPACSVACHIVFAYIA